MTTLRDTIAKALYAADLSEKSQPCGAAATYPMLADAVLCVLAQWEPSPRVIAATCDAWISGKDVRGMVIEALRAMAEES